MKKTVLLITIIGCVLCAISQVKKEPNIRVFYLPFKMKTLIAIDEKSIENEYDITSLAKKKSGELLKILASKGKKATLHEGDIRLKVVIDGQKPIVVDSCGVVKKGQNVYQLSKSDFDQLMEFIYFMLPENTISDLDRK